MASYRALEARVSELELQMRHVLPAKIDATNYAVGLIYEDTRAIRETQKKHGALLEKHGALLERQEVRLERQEVRLDRVGAQLEGQEVRLDRVEARLDRHGTMLEEILRRLPAEPTA